MPTVENAVAEVRETTVVGTLAHHQSSGSGKAKKGMPLTTPPHRIFDAPSARAAANLPRGSKVALTISGIDPDIAARDQSRINALLSECGCRLSAAILIAFVAAAIAIDILGWATFRQAPAAIVAGELLLAFVASGIGRVVGIANARKMLRAVLSSIADQIDDQQRRRVSWAA